MEVIDILAIITFVILLSAAIWMLINFYVCDSYNCKVFNDAAEKGSQGSKEYVLELLDGLFSDGIWPVPYIGAAILTPLALWFMGVDITVRSFAILFFISFATTYFIIGFFGHHYLRPIGDYVSDYIDSNFQTKITNKTGVIYEEDNSVCLGNENNLTSSKDDNLDGPLKFPLFGQDFGISFSESYKSTL